MSDDFPKNRGGWSGAGRTAARTIDGDDIWLRKRRFGAEARNKGGFLQVTMDQPATATGLWYSLGLEGGIPVIRGSSNAKGDFVLAGPAYASGSNIPQLFPRGDGSAYALRSLTADGFRTSVFNSNNPAYILDYYITIDGQTPITRPPVTLVGGYDGSSNYTPLIVLPSTSGTRRAGAYEFAFTYSTLDGLQHVIGVTFDDGVTQRHVIAARNDNNIIFPLGFNRLGPSTYIGLAGSYVYRASPPPGYSDANVPGLFFFATTDAGATWFTFPAPALIGYEQVNLAAYAAAAPFSGWQARYNTAVRDAGAQFVPLSRDRCLVWTMLGCVEFNSGSYYEMYRLRYGVADLPSQTISLQGTMFDPPFVTISTDYYAQVYYRYERNAVIAPGGGALVQFNNANYSASWTSQPQLYYTATGPLTLVGTMGLVAGKTGIPFAVSSSKLFTTTYDTEYSLYESSDVGITWTKRATVSDVAAAPVTGSLYTNVGLRSFANMVWLKDNGAPKNATPGAPWLSDDRLTPPS